MFSSNKVAKCLIGTLLLAATVCAARDRDYKSGKLTDIDIGVSAYGGTTREDRFKLTVEDEGMRYVGEYVMRTAWSYKPNDLTIGEPIKYRIDGSHLYLLRNNGKELKTTLLKREVAR